MFFKIRWVKKSHLNFRCDFLLFYFLKFKKTKSFFKKLKFTLSKYNEYFLLGPPNFEEPKATSTRDGFYQFH